MAVVVATLDIDEVVQATGANSWRASSIAHGPSWVHASYQFALGKWTLFAVGIYLGVALKN